MRNACDLRLQAFAAGDAYKQDAKAPNATERIGVLAVVIDAHTLGKVSPGADKGGIVEGVLVVPHP